MSISPEEEARLRAGIVEEAMSWLSTPFVNCGSVKGLSGAVDCAMLLVKCFASVGLIPSDFDPRPYNSNWHLHQNETLYLFGLEKWASRVGLPGPRQQQPCPGDVVMYRFGKHAAHGAIIVSDDLIVHAHKHIGKVMLCERRAMEDRLNSFWSVFA